MVNGNGNGVVNREERCEFTGGDRVCLFDKHRNSIAATDFETEQNTSISDTFKMSKVLTGRVGQNGNVGLWGKISWDNSLYSQFQYNMIMKQLCDPMADLQFHFYNVLN